MEKWQATGSELSKGLKRRHMNLIALGEVIGAGLFVGSGVVIASAGPAAVVSFLIGGLITMLIMPDVGRDGESLQPVVGSFYIYARQALGRRGGFVTGWMYWYFFVVVVAVGDGGRWSDCASVAASGAALDSQSGPPTGVDGDKSGVGRSHLVNSSIGSPRSRSLPSWSFWR